MFVLVIRAFGYALVKTFILLAVLVVYLAIFVAVLLWSDNNEAVYYSMLFGYFVVFVLILGVVEKWQWGNPDSSLHKLPIVGSLQ